VRIDSAHILLGMRVNQWTSILIFVLGMTLFLDRNRDKKKVVIQPEL
jgi:prolipoprotein diacylglyceryltransferase